jgi:UTP--glucose-1-phosphate uridylyltransferase
MLDIVRNILPTGVSCIYIRQAEPLGLGHAVLCAKPAIGNEPFAVLLADDLIDGGTRGCLGQMVDIYGHYNTGVIAVQPVPRSDTDKYGIVEVRPIDQRVGKIQSIVEKPKPDVAPSTLGVVGRYILPPDILGILEQTNRGAGGEIQLTDGIATLLERQQVVAYEFEGKRYDCGSKLGYLEATVEYALRHPELHLQFGDYLKSRMESM